VSFESEESGASTVLAAWLCVRVCACVCVCVCAKTVSVGG
jgi:hypothetical protein